MARSEFFAPVHFSFDAFEIATAGTIVGLTKRKYSSVIRIFYLPFRFFIGQLKNELQIIAIIFGSLEIISKSLATEAPFKDSITLLF